MFFIGRVGTEVETSFKTSERKQVFPGGSEVGVGGLRLAGGRSGSGLAAGLGGPGVSRFPIVPDLDDDLKLQYRR